MNPLSVLSSQNWLKLFAAATAEFHIAHGSPDDVVLSAIKAANNPFKLSLLDLAIMKGRETLVVKLLAKGENVHHEDLFGWKPIHHAALVSSTIFQALVANGADPKATTKAGISCEQIRLYAGLDTLTASLANLTVGETPIKAGSFPLKQFGMTTYSDAPYYPQEELQKLWAEKPQNDEILDKDKFDEMLKEGPKLTLKKVALAERNWGVFADEPLAFGKALFPYSGEVGVWTEKMTFTTALAAKKSWRRYQLGPINAETVGNIARFVNEGFPNCFVASLPPTNGSQNWYVVSCAEPAGIKKGDELLYDYGIAECLLKWNSLYTIPNKEAMRHFVRTTSLENVHQFIANNSLNYNKGLRLTKEQHELHLQTEAYLTKLYYCFHTPSAIIDLWCESLISAKSWFDTMVDFEKRYCRITQDVHKKGLVLIYLFMQYLIALEKVMPPNREKTVKTWIAKHLATHTPLEVSELIIAIHKWAKEPVRDAWIEFSENLDKTLPYDEARNLNDLTLVKRFTAELSPGA